MQSYFRGEVKQTSKSAAVVEVKRSWNRAPHCGESEGKKLKSVLVPIQENLVDWSESANGPRTLLRIDVAHERHALCKRGPEYETAPMSWLLRTRATDTTTVRQCAT